MKNIIAVVNQKGGVGKTTTAVNIAARLGQLKKKVLLIDLDPQGNATTGVGVEKTKIEYSSYDVLVNGFTIKKCTTRSPNANLDIVASNRNLSGAELDLIDMTRREYRLKDSLKFVTDDYDVIILDCPPSLSLLTVNALAAADYVLVPIQCEYYALEGLTDLLGTVNKIKEGINPSLEILGIIRTMFDGRNNLSNQVSDELIKHFATKVFKTYIPRNIRLAEAPSFGIPLVILDQSAIGSISYAALVNELIKRLK